MKLAIWKTKVKLGICGGMANFENFRVAMKVWVM
jgi:hypothetical protein